MPHALIFTVRDTRFDRDAPFDRMCEQVLAPFCAGDTLSIHDDGKSSASDEIGDIVLPSWDNDSGCGRFLHGAPIAETTPLPQVAAKWPMTLADVDRRIEWFATHYSWSIIAWPNTFREFVLAFITESSNLAKQFEHHWRRHPRTRAWNKRQSDPEANALIGAYQTSVAEQSFRIALYQEPDWEGEALWELCDCDRNAPYVHVIECEYRGVPSRPVKWTSLGFQVVRDPLTSKTRGTKIVTSILKPSSREALFSLLRCDEFAPDDDDLDDARDAMWTVFQADLPQISDDALTKWDNGLADIVELLERVDWLHTRHTGGGPGEFYNIFAARDPRMTHELIRRIEASARPDYGVSAVY